ncbi:MAG: SDR family oxidoreductase [Sphingobium sp.]
MSSESAGPAPVDTLSFDRRVAIVTGGNTAIGSEIALILARLSASVAMVGDRVDQLDASAIRIELMTDRPCLPLAADISGRDAIGRIVEQTVDVLGGAHIVIHCAAAEDDGASAAPHPDADAADAAFEARLQAITDFVDVVGPVFRAQDYGVIVNVVPLVDPRDPADPAIAERRRMQLRAFSRHLAQHWGQYGVRVNCVATGYIAPGEEASGRARTAADDPARALPLGRWGQPREVANVAVFLASEAASYVTGEVLTVGGGY